MASGTGAGAHLSREFFDLVKTIGESKSKQEEDRICSAEILRLKASSSAALGKGRALKEYLIRLIYVEMLGHDASFGYMKAVEVSRRRSGNGGSEREGGGREMRQSPSSPSPPPPLPPARARRRARLAASA